ncbi:MAG: universal stress protein UspA related nucleotide-binding protein [halophilic archaeon J07HB67]|jgi:Universal stress protein UspA and related nucleotide-binding proteins|nr:MAG: universal stress protein UspA related nucleotide-binding protein [halophilic archaeon J07HB67]
MYTFVVGVDADVDRARRQADAIATLPVADESVTVVLLHAFQENTAGGTVEQVKPVREARDRLREAGFDVQAEGYGGDPANAILTVADNHDADQIVVAGRKRSPTGKALFGSTTQDVVLGTDRPVLVCDG